MLTAESGSALSCSLRSLTSACHAHHGVKMHTAESKCTLQSQNAHRGVKMHTTESKCTPRSQNAHRRVRIENIVGLYMLRGENILCIKNGISHYLNRLACRCHAHRTASLSGVQMGYRIKNKWRWKILWYTNLKRICLFLESDKNVRRGSVRVLTEEI